jgi:TetR/AcrR family transcriptional regulator, ethionamide resistance regulator
VASLGRQSDKRAAVEAAVLEATEALLVEGASFAELGIERIATRAGISRTAFYFYFRDKRELLMRLTGEVNEQLMAAAATWWSGDADLRDALARIARLYDEHGALLRAVVEVSTYDEAVAGYWRGLVGRFVDATRERIETEQAAGRAPAAPAHAMAFAMVWMVERAFYEQRVQDRPVDGEELVDALTAVFERSVYGTGA